MQKLHLDANERNGKGGRKYRISIIFFPSREGFPPSCADIAKRTLKKRMYTKRVAYYVAYICNYQSKAATYLLVYVVVMVTQD